MEHLTEDQIKALNPGDRVLFRGRLGDRVGGTVISATWDTLTKRPMVRLKQDKKVFGCPYFFANELYPCTTS